MAVENVFDEREDPWQVVKRRLRKNDGLRIQVESMGWRFLSKRYPRRGRGNLDALTTREVEWLHTFCRRRGDPTERDARE